MTDSKFTGDFIGIGRMLRSEMIGQELQRRAELVLDRARNNAPVYEDGSHPGRYRDHFHIRLGLNHRRSRIEAVVYNDSPEALYVEKGTSHNPAHHTLVRALDILRSI